MRDYLAIIKQLEAYYPKARGTATLNGALQAQDEDLRQALVPFANSTMRAIERVNRWRMGYMTTTVVTASGTSLYSFSGGSWTHIHRIYWRWSTGRIVPLELMEQNEPRLVYGDGSGAIPGNPRFYALVGARGDQIQLFPTPDGAGPDAGNYTLQIEYYQELPQIIEAAATTGAASVTGTFVPANSGTYVLANGALSANPNTDVVVVRGAGAPTGLTGINAFDDASTTWSAIVANTFTMATAAVTVATGAQTFFYAANWLIDIWPKVLAFGMLREVAQYLQSDKIAVWDARYEKELEDLMEWDQQSRHDVEVLAAGVSGQRQAQLRDINWPQLFDERGVTN